MRKFAIILLILPCIFLTGCWNKAEFIDVIKLGARNKIIELKTADYGDSTFYLISNVDYDFEILSGEDWITITEVSSDSICFAYPTNNGFKRSATLRLSYASRVDELKVLQPGKYEARLDLSEEMIEVPAAGGTYAVNVLTNILEGDLRFEVSNDKMINAVAIDDNRLTFTVPKAASRDTKTYVLTVYSIDGWGERVEAELKLVQKSR